MKASDLTQFTGTEHYYQSSISNLWYSDGIQYFLQHTESYWLLDIVQFEVIFDKACKYESFLVIVVDGTTITVDDGNGHVLWTKQIQNTLTSQFKFYVEEAVCGDVLGKLLMLPSER